jgi:hypothetical protein
MEGKRFATLPSPRAATTDVQDAPWSLLVETHTARVAQEYTTPIASVLGFAIMPPSWRPWLASSAFGPPIHGFPTWSHVRPPSSERATHAAMPGVNVRPR